MNKNLVTLTNEFHGTSVRILAPKAGEVKKLSPGTAKRIEKALCGIKDCTCGMDALSQRPLRSAAVYVEEFLDKNGNGVVVHMRLRSDLD